MELLLLIIAVAIIIDIIFGELPSKIHPVILMGKLIKHFKPPFVKYNTRISGLILTLMVVIIFLGIVHFIIQISKFNTIIYITISAIILSTTFALKALLASANDIKNIFDEDKDIEKARFNVSLLVSRDTSTLSKEELLSATIESITENISDSVVSPLFYTLIFGVEGAITYRVINTLDSMVGYKTSKYINIGWFPAKLDDVVSYIPSRITAILIIISAALLKLNWKNAYRIMKRDADRTPSPNSGYPMAAAAGCLDIKLKKVGYYELGDALYPIDTNKIAQAILLSSITVTLFIIIFSIIFITIFIIFSH